MPLRDDLLEPIPGENPSGAELHNTAIFVQIKEARREDDDLPVGDWAPRATKKADHPLVVKLAGEALAKKSKDLRLAGLLIGSQFKLEAYAVLAPCIEFLRRLQESFWPTLYPEIEEGDLEWRQTEVEKALKQLVIALKQAPLTESGLGPSEYRESRTVGYKAEASTDAKERAREQAIADGKLTAEDFDREFAATPKSFYVQAEAALDEALQQTEKLDGYQREVYGSVYPNLQPLSLALEEIRLLVNGLLNERRKTEPDPVVVVEPVIEEDKPQDQSLPQPGNGSAAASNGAHAPRPTGPVSDLSQPADAYEQVVRSAEFLFESDAKSPVPYLVCAGLRLGETRMQGPSPDPGFAVGPSPEVRQTLRRLASEGAWPNLLRAALPVMAEPCARAWLDLHRYIWRAAQETGASAMKLAITSTVRGLLVDRPEIRRWTLEDDTGAANPETQAWIDNEVMNHHGG